MDGYYDKKLWSDLRNDTERVEFLLSGRAHETGIIAPAIVDDVAEAFAYRAKNKPNEHCGLCHQLRADCCCS